MESVRVVIKTHNCSSQIPFFSLSVFSINIIYHFIFPEVPGQETNPSASFVHLSSPSLQKKIVSQAVSQGQIIT